MGTGKIIQADNIDGLKTVKNFISNGNATLNTSGWATYKDAAGTRPVDGTGGSPTLVTFTRTTTSPLSDAASFLFSVAGSSSAQGEGASCDFTIDASQKAKVLKIELDYIVNSGTFAAGSSTTDSDLIVYLYDVTNGVLIEPSSFKFLSNSTTISDKFSATFQSASNSTSYRLIFHVASTSTAAYSLKFDNISVSPSQYVYGTPITDWVSYTPTGSWTTNTTYSGRWRRVGDQLEVRGAVNLTGAPNAANLTINLPTGFTIDTDKTPNRTVASNMVLGLATIYNGAGATWTNGRIMYFGTNGVIVTSLGNGGNAYNTVTATVPFTFANNTSVFFEYKVPILGWSSSVQMSDGYDGRVVGAHLHRNSSSQTAGPNGSVVKILLTSTAGTFDDVAGFDSTNNRYVVKTSGRYRVKGRIYIGSPNTLSNYYSCRIYKNGAAINTATFVKWAASTEGALSDDITLNLVAGDYLELYFQGDGDNSVNQLTINGAPNATYLSVEKLSGSPTISAQETIGALYTGAPPTGTLNNSFNKVTFGTKVKDSHGAYSGGVYTIPTSGQYDIEAKISVNATFTTIYSSVDIGIYVDGSLYSFARNNYPVTASTGTNIYPRVCIFSVPLRAGQPVEIRSRVNDYSGTPVFESAAAVNQFSIVRSGGY